MAKKKNFPRTLFAFETTDIADDPIIITAETPEDISEEYADQPVAVYQLIAVGKLNVEKSVDAKPVKKISVGRRSR